jgi:epsilon-lactone hydrolase
MQSLRSYFLRRGIKLGVKRLTRRKSLSESSFEDRRQALNRIAKKWINLPADCKVEALEIDGIYTEWLSNEQSAADKVILYLHGGAYGYCSADTHRSLAARIMKEAGVKVLLPEYRLAPEHPFPAAIEDAVAAYHWLQEQGYKPGDIIFTGDSAGGGLSIATAVTLRDMNEPLPAAIVCLSPWVDLTGTGESYFKNKAKDPYLNAESALKAARAYAGGQPLTHPLISPVFADLTGLPPLFIQVGSIEILLSDAEKLAQKAKLAGVEVTFTVWKGMWHVFQMSRKMTEAKRAVREIGRFAKETFAQQQGH